MTVESGMPLLRQVWKVPLGDFTICKWTKHPLDGEWREARAVGYQGSMPMLWVEVLPGLPGRPLETCVIGSGMDTPTGHYVGTLIEPPDGKYIWHVYAR